MYKGLSLTIQKMKTFLMRGLRGISNDEKAQEQRGKIAQVIHIKNLYITIVCSLACLQFTCTYKSAKSS